MAKIAIKSEKLSPFGGIFSIMEQFALCLPSQPATFGSGRILLPKLK